MTSNVSRAISMTAAVGMCAFAVAGCGDSSGSSSSGTSTATPSKAAGTAASGVDAALRAKLPAAIRDKGTLTVAADATYPPNEFIGQDGKTVEGMDADLAAALAGAVGLKASVKNATFDSIIPGLAAHKYDLGMSSFTDTKEREKTVDFVTYFSAGTSFYVKAQGGPTVNASGRPLRQDGRSGEGDDAADRCRGTEQEVQRRQGDRPDLPRPERRQPGPRQRPRAGRHG